jgi:hypothetical protein
VSRTYHHRAQRTNNRRYEVWSRRCKLVSMWAFNEVMKRITRRYERRQAKEQIRHEVTS